AGRHLDRPVGCERGDFRRLVVPAQAYSPPLVVCFQQFRSRVGYPDASLLILFSSPNEETQSGIADSGRLASGDGGNSGTIGAFRSRKEDATGDEGARSAA